MSPDQWWWKCIQSLQQPKKLWNKSFCSHQCDCWWPCTIRFLDICRHSTEHVWVFTESRPLKHNEHVLLAEATDTVNIWIWNLKMKWFSENSFPCGYLVRDCLPQPPTPTNRALPRSWRMILVMRVTCSMASMKNTSFISFEELMLKSSRYWKD